MTWRLRGRVGVVTGASRGLGRAVALALAAEGMHLALPARGGAEVRELAERIAAEHRVPVLPFAVDVRDPAAVARVVAHVEQQLGPVDLLVTGPDATESRALPDGAAPPREPRGVPDPGLRGSLLLCQALLPPMLQRGHGHVVNLVGVVDRGRAATGSVGGATAAAYGDHALPLLTEALTEPVTGTELSGTGVVLVDVLPGEVRPPAAGGAPSPADLSGGDCAPAARVVAVVLDVATGRHDDRSGSVLDAAVLTGS